MDNEEREWQIEAEAQDKRDDLILKRLKKKLPPSWYKAIEDVFSNLVHHYHFEITKTTGGKKYDERYRFRNMFSDDNYCSYSDSSTGIIWIPIKNGNYLKFYYSA